MGAATIEPSNAATGQLALPADEYLMAKTEARALALLQASLQDTSRKEANASKRLARLLADDAGRDLLLDLTDQVLRMAWQASARSPLLSRRSPRRRSTGASPRTPLMSSSLPRNRIFPSTSTAVPVRAFA
ncbi:MAG: hypothetical protein EBY60_09520 [Actinobacteria bacterium]|nr:hypothetical protein [Actinomycetota bacterium]